MFKEKVGKYLWCICGVSMTFYMVCKHKKHASNFVKEHLVNPPTLSTLQYYINEITLGHMQDRCLPQFAA